MATIELEHAIGYSCDIPNSIIFHPNGTDYVYMSGGCVVIADTRDAHNQEFLRAHDSDITCIDVSKSGNFIASGQDGENADVIVWNFKTRKSIFRLNEHDYAVSAVKFSEDERLLVTVGNDKRLIIWDTETGNIVAPAPLPSTGDTLVAWGGKVRDIKKRETKNYQLATASNKEIYIWELDPATGDLLKFRVNTGPYTRDYTTLVFSANGDFIYAGSTSGDISSIIVKSRQLAQPFKVCSLGVKAIARYEDQDKTKLIVGGGDGSISIFSGSGKDFIHEQKLQLVDVSSIPSGISINSISIGKSSIMAGTSAGDVFLVQFDGSFRGKCLLNQNHVGSVLAVEFPTGVNDKFATISVDSTVRYWDSTDYSIVSAASFPPSGETPLCVCFLNDIILTGWSDGSIRSVDTETGELLWTLKQAHRGSITVIKSGHNAKFFVTGGQDGQVRVWAVKTRELVSSFKEHHAAITDLVVLEDDAHVMSSSKDKCIFCWDLRRERRISCHEHRMGGVNGFVVLNDQTTIISIGSNKQITFWDIRQPESVRIFEYSKSKSFEPTCIALSHDNSFFAVGGTDENVNFYDTRTGQKLAIGKGHSGVINSLKFSPDDKQLISVAQDGCIFVFNVFRD